VSLHVSAKISSRATARGEWDYENIIVKVDLMQGGRANRARRPAGPLTCGARDIRDVHRSAGTGIDVENPVCDYTFFPLAPHPGATSSCDRGRLAQLGEHLVYTERAGGSSPSPPTRARPGQRESFDR
jgi:hypothetical protein